MWDKLLTKLFPNVDEEIAVATAIYVTPQIPVSHILDVRYR